MNLHPSISKAERVGRGLGIAYRGLFRREQQLRLWLIQGGLSESGAKLVAWSVRLSVLLLLLSFSILLAGLVAGLFLIGRGVVLGNLSNREPETEWRNGHSGFGLYTRDGWRIDPYIFDDD